MTYLRVPQIVEHIGVLENMANYILAVIKPANKGGRPRNKAMPLWVNNIYALWTRTLGLPFAFDQYKGTPLTDAAIFGWKALLLIDSDASWLKFRTAMRQAVGLDRRGRGRHRPT